MVTPAAVVNELQGLESKDDILDVIKKHCMKFKPVSYTQYNSSQSPLTRFLYVTERAT